MSPGTLPRASIVGTIFPGLAEIGGMPGALAVHTTVLGALAAAAVLPGGCSAKPYFGDNNVTTESRVTNLMSLLMSPPGVAVSRNFGSPTLKQVKCQEMPRFDTSSEPPGVLIRCHKELARWHRSQSEFINAKGGDHLRDRLPHPKSTSQFSNWKIERRGRMSRAANPSPIQPPLWCGRPGCTSSVTVTPCGRDARTATIKLVEVRPARKQSASDSVA